VRTSSSVTSACPAYLARISRTSAGSGFSGRANNIVGEVVHAWTEPLQRQDDVVAVELYW
jgi:hypothetical protein